MQSIIETIRVLWLRPIYLVSCHAQSEMRTISMHDMKVSWFYQEDRIFFELTAPTKGWVTIGSNPDRSIVRNY